MSRTLVFGRTGQVAQALRLCFPEAIAIGRDEVDFETSRGLLLKLNDLRPTLIINAAAYTEVDKAETETSAALAVNAQAPGEIAKWCKANGASLVHYSTDYVYSGEGERAWREIDPVHPRNQYGLTKLVGERAISESGCHHIILRSSWVHSAVGKNFVKTIVRLAKEKEILKIVADQVGAPTYASDIAEATAMIVAHRDFAKTTGIFNLANSGTTSWHGIAVHLVADLAKMGASHQVKEIQPLPTSGYPTAARRPLNSRLNTEKIETCFGIKMRPWENGVDDCLKALLSI